MSTTPLLAAAAETAAAENVIGAGTSENLKYPAGKNTCARELAAASGNLLGAGEKSWALMHEGRRARELAAAASSLAEELRGSELDVFVGPAKSIAASAAAYAESLRDANTASNLEFALAEFNRLFNNTKPKNLSSTFDEFRRKSSMVLRQYRCHPRADAKHDAGNGKRNLLTEPKHGAADGKPKPRKNDAGDGKWKPSTEPKNDVPQAQDSQALNIADVAELLAVQLSREAPASALATTAQALAQEARKFAEHPTDRNARALVLLTSRALLGAAKDEPPQFTAALQEILLSAAEALGVDARDNPPRSNTSSRPQPQMPVLYAMALAAPVSLITSAAGLHLFPENWTWVAGAGVAVWILATGGMLLNQFGKMDWEQVAGAHLGRFGVFGAVILMIFYAYRAYFPSVPSALIFLVVLALVVVGIPWIISCFRPDDASTATTSDTIPADRIDLSGLESGRC